MFREILVYQLVILLGLHIAFINGQVYQTKTEIVCAPGNVKLECATGEVINIISAYYGRTNDVTCPTGNITNQHCYTPGAKYVISQICQNKPECIVYAKNEVFGNPCYGTTKYLEVHYICVKSDIKSTVICDGNPLALTCPSGHVINIVNANFGRYNSLTCPSKHVSNIYCTAAVSKDVISNQCHNKEECTVNFSFMFGDPCYGTSKYLDVQYRCVAKESSPVLLSTSPPLRGCVRNVSLVWDGMNWVHAE